MSRTFTKLFSSITESTIWCEPDRTRLVWICMLAMADQHGRVWASVPGLANRARVPVEDAQTALDAFLSPDPYSRTPDHGGRRIEPIDGGWRLLNHEKYRSIRDEETIKESKRNYINARRAKEREGVEKSRTLSNSVDRGRANAEADTEAYAEKEEAKASLSTGEPSDLPPCPHKEIIGIFAELLPALPSPKPELWSGARAKQLAARWKWVMTAKKTSGDRYATNREEGLAFFRRMFAYVAKSCPHLTGGNDRGWTADLGWLANETNFAKVMQGNYERQEVGQ